MKKWFITLIVFACSFMFYTSKVNALIDTVTFDTLGINSFGSLSNQTYSKNLYSTTPGIFANYNGWVLFTLTYYSPNGGVSSDNPVINSIGVLTGNQILTCDIGTISSYTDNNTSAISYTANCPVTFGSNGISGIVIEKLYSGVGQFRLSNNITFYDNREQNQNVVSQLQFSTNDILSLLGSINVNNVNNFDTISSQISSILTAIQNSANIQQQISSNTQAAANNTNDIKNDIKSENTSGAESSADDLKNNSAFQDNTGLSGVISMPLTFVNSLTNSCQAITLTIPYMDEELTIPCLQPIISNKIPLLANLIKIVINGFIVYKVLLDIFQIVRNAKNPEDDRIEVLDL